MDENTTPAEGPDGLVYQCRLPLSSASGNHRSHWASSPGS